MNAKEFIALVLGISLTAFGIAAVMANIDVSPFTTIIGGIFGIMYCTKPKY